ncbi:hypothetical protein [Namhaeicola litoreus]|uniref:Holin n=1 Tax=Namhaeicola litoreus TaxID=1052145 RepID=A0ABW3Y2W7_9FLAO
MNILERIKKPTPTFFKKLRNIGLTMAAAGGAILTAPISIPTIILTIAGYLTLAGTVVSAISQTVVSDDDGEVDTKGDG